MYNWKKRRRNINIYENIMQGLNEAVDYCEGEHADAVVHEISSDKPSENDMERAFLEMYLDELLDEFAKELSHGDREAYSNYLFRLWDTDIVEYYMAHYDKLHSMDAQAFRATCLEEIKKNEDTSLKELYKRQTMRSERAAGKEAKLKYYNSLVYKLVVKQDTVEGGYVASYPGLPGCLTCGDTLEAAKENDKDAKGEWLEAALDSSMNIPEPKH
jgi:predicted RNase H-like HicB family nuclease